MHECDSNKAYNKAVMVYYSIVHARVWNLSMFVCTALIFLFGPVYSRLNVWCNFKNNTQSCMNQFIVTEFVYRNQ